MFPWVMAAADDLVEQETYLQESSSFDDHMDGILHGARALLSIGKNASAKPVDKAEAAEALSAVAQRLLAWTVRIPAVH